METMPATRNNRRLATHTGLPVPLVVPKSQEFASYRRKGSLATFFAVIFVAFAATARAQNADLSVTKSGPASVTAGNDIFYKVSVANAKGPQSSSPNNVLTDMLPPGTTFVSATPDTGWACTAPPPGGPGSIVCTNPNPILMGSSFNFTFVLHVSSSTPPRTMITNTATISHAGTDPDSTNNTSTATTVVTAPPPTFDTCLKDNSTGNLLQWNSTTGQYQFTRCSDSFTLTGTGVVKVVNGIKTLTDFKSDRRISAGLNTGQLTGNATIYLMVAQGVWQAFQIVDTDPAAVCACT
jgi:uncharacterized repeat protein (TIGR01451 family)